MGRAVTDTKSLEELAERTISGLLIRSGILLAKPMFDQLGGDLIGFSTASEKAALCRIQCKYRDCTKRSQVVIDSQYVTGAFVLFLYLKLPNDAKVACLLPPDVKRLFRAGTVKKKAVLRLSLTEKSAASFAQDTTVQFTPDKADEIKKLMKAASPVTELHHASVRVMKSADELITATNRRAQLEKLMLQFRLAETKKKAAEESLEILGEYKALIDRRIADASSKPQGNSKEN